MSETDIADSIGYTYRQSGLNSGREFTILPRNSDKIVFSTVTRITFMHTIFANISAANFRNSSFTVQSFRESERTYSSRLN